MGFLDDVVGKVKEAVGGEQSALLNGVLGLLSGGGQAGGFQGLIQSLRDKGLDEIVSSWISTGGNLPITAEQLKSGLGAEVIGKLAAKAGIPADVATAKIAEILPGIIDRLTPDGKIPEPGILQDGLNLLRANLPKS